MGVKMNLRIITKNHEADPEIGFLTKSISKPYGAATAMPPAWGLTKKFHEYCPSFIYQFRLAYENLILCLNVFLDSEFCFENRRQP